MKNLYFTVFFCFIFATSKAQSIPSPSEFLGYELGTQFTRHHQVVAYFEAVAAASDQVNLSSYGKTYEGRTLQIASISSARKFK
jgi:hypothetical protein